MQTRPQRVCIPASARSRSGNVEHDPKLDALLALAREYTSNVGSVQDTTWQTAVDAGWTDEQLTELSVHVTLNLFTNYFNHFVGTELDLPEAPAIRALLPVPGAHADGVLGTVRQTGSATKTSERHHRDRRRHPFLLRSGLSVRLDDEQVGPAGPVPAGLHRGLAVHLAPPGELRGRLRQSVPAGVRGRAHRGPPTAPGAASCPFRARSRGRGSPLRGTRGRIFDSAPASPAPGNDELDLRGTAAFLAPILAEVGLPQDLVQALDDDSLDLEIRMETDEALALTGKDVGTPIIHFQPPTGVAFFGPVISRLPDEDDAVRLWDHVLGLAAFPGFAELKRSLRELPQLRGLGVDPGEVGVEQDWHGGSRRTKR